MKRTMSIAYYSKIYDWPSNQQVKTSESENASTHRGTSSVKSEVAFESSTNSLNMYMPPPSNRTVLSKEQNCDTNKKRNTKMRLREMRTILIICFIKIKSFWYIFKSLQTRLRDFNRFSLSIDPAAVPKYLRWKFNLDSNLEDKDIILQGTALKYLSIWLNFLGSLTEIFS